MIVVIEQLTMIDRVVGARLQIFEMNVAGGKLSARHRINRDLT